MEVSKCRASPRHRRCQSKAAFSHSLACLGSAWRSCWGLICRPFLGCGLPTSPATQYRRRGSNPDHRAANVDSPDIKSQEARDSGLGAVSVLMTGSHERVKDAFELHPWVASVERITRRLPSSIDIEQKYHVRSRLSTERPVGRHVSLIDDHAVRLPRVT